MQDDAPGEKFLHPGKYIARRGIITLGILAVLIMAIYFLVSNIEKNNRTEETRGDLTDRFQDEKTITYLGEEYKHRSKLTKILIMGIDQGNDVIPTGSRNGGQADFLLLLVIDGKHKTLVPMEIDRDTMTPITILGVLGNPAGTRTAQISLSHGFGDGREQSSQFTADAVTRLLLGEPIDYYISMKMDGISVLNDWVGGVTVTLTDDFSALDPQMLPGVTLTLQGDQAEYYVRSRMNIGIGTNEARMLRQQIYLNGLRQLLDTKIREDENSIGKLYDALEPYLVTNMKRGRMINIAWITRQFERAPVADLPGEHTIGADGFMEYIVNQDQLTATIMQQFYEPVTKPVATSTQP